MSVHVSEEDGAKPPVAEYDFPANVRREFARIVYMRKGTVWSSRGDCLPLTPSGLSPRVRLSCVGLQPTRRVMKSGSASLSIRIQTGTRCASVWKPLEVVMVSTLMSLCWCR